jgi:hypothetical protein
LAATGEAPAAHEYLDRADAHIDLSPRVLSLYKLIVSVDIDIDLGVPVGAAPATFYPAYP